MTQQFNPTKFPAPTADTEAGPEFHYSNGELLLSFRDYRKNDVRIRFRNVLGIRWTEEDDSGHGLRDDEVYEVRDSDWIRKLQGLGAIPSAHGYRHLKIGFNELAVCVEGNPKDDMNSETEKKVKKIQLMINDYDRYRPLLGKNVSVKGKLMHSFTGHHHTPVLLQVESMAKGTTRK